MIILCLRTRDLYFLIISFDPHLVESNIHMPDLILGC